MPAMPASSFTRSGFAKFDLIQEIAFVVRWLWSPRVAIALSRAGFWPLKYPVNNFTLNQATQKRYVLRGFDKLYQTATCI